MASLLISHAHLPPVRPDAAGSPFPRCPTASGRRGREPTNWVRAVGIMTPLSDRARPSPASPAKSARPSPEQVTPYSGCRSDRPRCYRALLPHAATPHSHRLDSHAHAHSHRLNSHSHRLSHPLDVLYYVPSHTPSPTALPLHPPNTTGCVPDPLPPCKSQTEPGQGIMIPVP